MAKVTQLDGWYCINTSVFIGSEAPSQPVDTVLAYNKWVQMRYGTENKSVIDFPWEYEHNGVVVRCWESWEQLHYLLRFPDGETVAVLMNPKSVEHDALKSASVYLCNDIETKERVEQNEFEGEVMLFADAIA